MSDQSQAQKRTLSQWVTLLILGLVIPLLLATLAVRYVMDRDSDAAHESALSIALPSDLSSPKIERQPAVLRSGREIYLADCAVCHSVDASEHWPRFGKARDWAERNKQGLDVLVKHVSEGKGAMPAYGATLPAAEIARVVIYMANAGGADFGEQDLAGLDGAASGENERLLTDARIAALASHAGKRLYDANCVFCHGTGAAGAPKLGDKRAWAARIKQGNDTLFRHAIKGFKGMPAKGGTLAPDAELKAAVEYMVSAAK